MKSQQRHQRSKGLNFVLLAAFAGILACAAMIVGLGAVPDAGSRRPNSDPVAGKGARAWTFYRGLFLDPATGAGLRTVLEAADSEAAKSLVGPSAPPRAAASVAFFLGRVGRRDSLRTLATLLARPEESVHKAAQDGIISVLRRHPGPRTWAVLRSLSTNRKLTFLARARLVQALTSVDHPRARECLEDLLGVDPRVDLTILPALGAAIAAHGEADGTGLAERVRAFLSSHDPALRRESALLLGRLRDLEALPLLVGLLGDANPGVRDNAHWALCDMTALRLPKSQERWSRWLEEEAGFVAGDGVKMLDDLRSGDEAKIAEALRDVSEHPLLRTDAESELLSLLADDRPGIRNAAGHALQRLRSRKAPQASVGK